MKALENQPLERRLAKRDDRRAIPGMVHAKTSIVEETPSIIGMTKPGRVLKLEGDGLADGIVVSIAEGRGWDIEELGERDLRQGTALNIHCENNTVIRVVDLPGVGHVAEGKVADA